MFMLTKTKIARQNLFKVLQKLPEAEKCMPGYANDCVLSLRVPITGIHYYRVFRYHGPRNLKILNSGLWISFQFLIYNIKFYHLSIDDRNLEIHFFHIIIFWLSPVSFCYVICTRVRAKRTLLFSLNVIKLLLFLVFLVEIWSKMWYKLQTPNYYQILFSSVEELDLFFM